MTNQPTPEISPAEQRIADMLRAAGARGAAKAYLVDVVLKRLMQQEAEAASASR